MFYKTSYCTHRRRHFRIFWRMLQLVEVGLVSYGIFFPVNQTSILLFVSLVSFIWRRVLEFRSPVSDPKVRREQTKAAQRRSLRSKGMVGEQIMLWSLSHLVRVMLGSMQCVGWCQILEVEEFRSGVPSQWTWGTVQRLSLEIQFVVMVFFCRRCGRGMNATYTITYVCVKHLPILPSFV